MRHGMICTALALLAALVLGERGMTQPPPSGPRGLERALEDLKLSGKKQEDAAAAVKAFRDQVKRTNDKAGEELLGKVKDVLSEEGYRRLKAALAGEPPPPRDGERRGVGTADVADRLLSFDKDRDGKVVKEELPERMHDLIAKGDTNRDGTLDADEIRRLSANPRRGDGFRGFGRRGGPPPGPGGPLPRIVDETLEELRLSDGQKEKVGPYVKTFREDVRKGTEQPREELLARMGKLLNADELRQFKEVVDRQPPPFRP
jgi:hypothetical protein